MLYLANSHGEVLVTINLANLYRATLAMLAILPAIEDAWRRAPAPAYREYSGFEYRFEAQ